MQHARRLTAPRKGQPRWRRGLPLGSLLCAPNRLGLWRSVSLRSRPASLASKFLTMRSRRNRRRRPVRENLVTDAYALITDEDAGTCDELLDLLVALAAERTLEH